MSKTTYPPKRSGVFWKSQANAIRRRIRKAETLESVAQSYGVSRQRLYQVLQKLDIPTALRQRKTIVGNTGPLKYWLNRSLVKVNVPRSERLRGLVTIDTPRRCPILDIPLDYISKYSHNCDNSPSVDRIDNTHGYTISNIHIISWKANRIKSNATATELLVIGKYMEKVESKQNKLAISTNSCYKGR